MQNFPTRQISEIGLVNSHCHTQHLQSDTFQTLIVSAAVSTLLLHTLPLLARESRCTTIPQSGRTRSWRSGTGRQLRDKRSRYLSTLVDNCQRISYLHACHNLDQHITQSFLSPPGALIAIRTYYCSTTSQAFFRSQWSFITTPLAILHNPLATRLTSPCHRSAC